MLQAIIGSMAVIASAAASPKGWSSGILLTVGLVVLMLLFAMRVRRIQR